MMSIALLEALMHFLPLLLSEIGPDLDAVVGSVASDVDEGDA